MKKSLTIFVAASLAMMTQAQTVNIHYTNGNVVQLPSEQISYVDFHWGCR